MTEDIGNRIIENMLVDAQRVWNDRTFITITVPANMWLSSNDRRYWANKAARTKLLRRLGFFEARRQVRGLRFERANVYVAVAYPRNGRADPPNAWPAVKAILDGFTDARLWDDDDSEHVVKTSFTRHPEPTRIQGVHALYFHLTGIIA